MSTIYKETETDSRALTKTFIDKLNGELHPFVELIDNDDRLELCFRGNQSPNQAVIIYYKNHQMFKILDTGKISFNYNHVRYCLPEEEKKYRAKLLDLGFTIKDKYNDKGEMDIGEITRTKAGKIR